jgi:hypothetical protein
MTAPRAPSGFSAPTVESRAGLMLNFSVEFGAKQHNGVRNPQCAALTLWSISDQWANVT